MEEARRRAYLEAMQVTSWLPRTSLILAAPSRPELLIPAQPVVLPEVAPRQVVQQKVKPASEKPSPRITLAPAKPVQASPEVPASEPSRRAAEPVPRFALQLLRAGACLLVVELPTGEPFQARDPAYLLLKDLLRAARLPTQPQLVGDGEPIRWPLLDPGRLAQGVEAARDYVQGVVAMVLEDGGCACLWLVGEAALRFATTQEAPSDQGQVETPPFGAAFAISSLERLIEQPALKARAWRALRSCMTHWDVP